MRKMLTFTDLLTIQRKLNSHLEEKPKRNDDVLWALITELGELGQARKGEWCWWKRYGKTFEARSREAQIEECVDVLHFALTGILQDTSKVSSLHDIWQYAWDQTKPVTLSEVLNCYVLPAGGIWVTGAVKLAKLCGFTREEIEAAFLAKVQKNKDRWTKTESPKEPATSGWLSWASSLLRF